MSLEIDNLKLLKESEDHIEFKRAIHNYPFGGGDKKEPKERRKCVLGYVVALANEKGGRLVLGMEDARPHAVSGSDFRDGQLGQLEDDIYERLGIRVTTEELFEDDKRVVVITVPSRPLGKTLKFEGVPLMRTGESLREMSDDEIFRILSEREPDFSATICEGLTLDDLDENAATKMKREYANKQKNPAFETIPTAQAVSDLGLSIDGKLTYAALILLGKSEALKKYLPQEAVIVEYRQNHAMIPYTARKVFQSALFTEIDDIWAYIDQPASNPLQHYSDGPYIFDIPAFNEETIREGILNSICHRSLKIQSEVVVKQYPDGMTITNAGGFPSGVDEGNILTVNSVPRCKLLSDVLEKTGLVERSGQGVDKMFFNCLMEGKALPTYAGTDNYQVCLNFTAAIEEPELMKFFQREQAKRPKDQQLNVFDLLTLFKIHKYCFDNLPQNSVERLSKEGLLEYSNGKFKILGDYENKNAKLVESLGIENLASVHALFESNTFISRSMLSSLFDGKMTLKQIRNFISKMEQNGLINRDGEGKNTRYSQTDKFRRLFIRAEK